MTIPKFRAWDKHIGKMFSVGIIDYTIHSVYVKQPNGLYTESDFDEVELMQSTGMVDENGKEVFEGDIVLIYGEKISKVFYSQGSFCVDILNGGTPLHAFSSEQLKVISNVYENPELLEEKE